MLDAQKSKLTIPQILAKITWKTKYGGSFWKRLAIKKTPCGQKKKLFAE